MRVNIAYHLVREGGNASIYGLTTVEYISGVSCIIVIVCLVYWNGIVWASSSASRFTPGLVNYLSNMNLSCRIDNVDLNIRMLWGRLQPPKHPCVLSKVEMNQQTRVDNLKNTNNIGAFDQLNVVQLLCDHCRGYRDGQRCLLHAHDGG